ncbi:MAG: hypothetical protein ACOYN0_09175 [Phycisphaerales bacterium]
MNSPLKIPKGFVFKLQPKLDQWAEQQEQAEQLLAFAIAARRECDRTLREAERKKQEGVQQLRAARENRGDEGAFSVLDSGRFVSAMEQVLLGLQASVRSAEAALEDSNKLLALRRKELADIRQAIESLERLRDKQIEEFLREAERLEELAREEAAIQAWTRQQPERGEV